MVAGCGCLFATRCLSDRSSGRQSLTDRWLIDAPATFVLSLDLQMAGRVRVIVRVLVRVRVRVRVKGGSGLEDVHKTSPYRCRYLC